MAEGNRYTLGSSERETDRLIRQASIVEPRMRALFEAAGIAAGMEVLDLGSGAGDVSLLVREFVGEAGKVVGVDKDSISLARARSRAAEAGYANVSFVEADLTLALPFEDQFDAIVGRRVLMYLPRKQEVLSRLLQHLRPGGIVAIQELDTEQEHAPLSPPSELYDRIARWAWAAFKVTGADTKMGSHLAQLLVDCGLPEPQVHVFERTVEQDLDRSLARLEGQFNTGRSLLPVIRDHGLAPAEDLERFEEYEQAIRREVEVDGKRTVGTSDYNVWARLPA